MKISKSQLRTIIKEELEKALNTEAIDPAYGANIKNTKEFNQINNALKTNPAILNMAKNNPDGFLATIEIWMRRQGLIPTPGQQDVVRGQLSAYHPSGVAESKHKSKDKNEDKGAGWYVFRYRSKTPDSGPWQKEEEARKHAQGDDKVKYYSSKP